jgi:kynurenine formamidase
MGTARFVDVSHVIEHGMVTHKGMRAPLICDYLARAFAELD